MATDSPRWYDLSVRVRTTLAATFVVGVALLCAQFALSLVLQNSLVSDIEQVAELRATALAESAERDQLDPTISADDDEAVQIVNARKQVIAASENVAGQPPFATITPKGQEPSKTTVEKIPGLAGHYRVIALAATTSTGPITIYVATDLKHADATRLLADRSLYVGIPLLVALVAATTWITVGRALRPVDAIRRRVAEISRSDLSERVPVSRKDDEVSRLARTMNAMLERLQTAFDQQRQFVADASHELQTPLAAVRTDLEVALRHPDSTQWADTAQALLVANGRMERLVADLLFVARSESEVSPLPFSPVDLHEVVLGEIVRLNKPSWMTVDSSGIASAFVSGRKDDLARVVRNLLDNAVQFAQTEIVVTVKTLADAVTLTVADDGPGIAVESRSRIFERFSRVDDARSRDAGGTGLGLAIAKEIVERHGGTITVSAGASGGAQFDVVLPAD